MAAADLKGFVVPACKIVLAKSSKNDNDTAHGTIDKVRFKTG